MRRVVAYALAAWAWMIVPGMALASPILSAPLAQVLQAAPPTALAASSAAQGAATSSTGQPVCAPMCVVPRQGQSVQQTIDAIEQAAHCAISNPPGACKPASTSYWSTMQFSTQGLQTLERLEGWSNQNDPAKGEIPGVCYDDSGGHGTVGYGHEYSKGRSCLWLMQNPKLAGTLYQSLSKNPLAENSTAAIQLLQEDVQTKAIIPIEQQVHVQLTQQQFDALVIWVFNVGAGGLSESVALQSMNTCQMSAVPSDFTHYDHVNGPVSCGLYRRDMVSGEIWISDAYTVPRNTFACPKGSAP
jgi:GH24 family phage-related lysozyme (muramidase)